MRTLKKLKSNKRRLGDFVVTKHKHGCISLKLRGKHVRFVYTDDPSYKRYDRVFS